MDENTWLSGTLLVIIGVVMGMFGRAYFPWIMGAFSTVVAWCCLMLLCSVLGWLEEIWAIIVLTIVSAAIALVCGFFVKKLIPISMALIGVLAGLFAGLLLYSIQLAISEYDELWLLIVLAVVGGLIGGYFSCNYRKGGFLSLTTAFLGGYMFMRGWTYYFGKFPTEIE